MVKAILWVVSVGASFYGGMLYAGYYLIDVPDSSLVKVISFVKGVKKLVEVIGS